MHRYRDAINDLLASLAADENYVKAYYRIAQAHQELSEFDRAMEFITRAIAIDAENTDILELKAEIEKEMAELDQRPKDATDDAYFETMTKWMDDEGADYSKLDMRWYWEGYRGVHALTFIPKGETLLYVPLNNIITLEMARKTSIG